MTDDEVRTVLLAAAEHEAFEECFGLPGYLRIGRAVEVAVDYSGQELLAGDVLAGGRLDVPGEDGRGWSSRFFEAIFRGHQAPWNGGARR